MRVSLLKLTELKDEKIQLGQSLLSQLEGQYKFVAESIKFELIKREKSPPPLIKSSAAAQPSVTVTAIKLLPATPTNATNTSANNNTNSNNLSTETTEKSAKRIRRTRIDTLDVDSPEDMLLPPSLTVVKQSTTPQIVQTTASTSAKRLSINASNKKTKKRKATKKQTTTQAAQEPVDDIIQDDGIDPDETTYCICQQISYGEMIFCENDTCPIEWFHFSCVDLTSKPKGRWWDNAQYYLN